MITVGNITTYNHTEKGISIVIMLLLAGINYKIIYFFLYKCKKLKVYLLIHYQQLGVLWMV